MCGICCALHRRVQKKGCGNANNAFVSAGVAPGTLRAMASQIPKACSGEALRFQAAMGRLSSFIIPLAAGARGWCGMMATDWNAATRDSRQSRAWGRARRWRTLSASVARLSLIAHRREPVPAARRSARIFAFRTTFFDCSSPPIPALPQASAQAAGADRFRRAAKTARPPSCSAALLGSGAVTGKVACES